jgi:hypothetical protein
LEVVVAHRGTIPAFAGGTKKNQENLQSEQPLTRRGFETSTFRIQIYCVADTTLLDTRGLIGLPSPERGGSTMVCSKNMEDKGVAYVISRPFNLSSLEWNKVDQILSVYLLNKYSSVGFNILNGCAAQLFEKPSRWGT